MKYRSIVVAVILISAAQMASADTLDVVKGDSSWHAFQTPSVNGTAFWNNSSYDNNRECNIGFWLSGAGGCGARAGLFLANSPKLTPDYLGNTSTGFNITKAADTQSVTITSRMEVTAYKDVNEVGWYNTSNPSVLNPLFTGVGTLGATATFVPSASYGFYVKSPEGTYLSNGTGDSRTHFAVFQLTANGRYLFGIEDMWTGGDWDYNDMVFDVQVSNVPEPATIMLVGSGLAWIGAASRRRRARIR